MKKLFMVLIVFCTLFGCSSGNLEDIKEKAPEIWEQHGFSIVGYQGYQWGPLGTFGSTYGGAEVWYTLKRVPDNGILYEGALGRWGTEYHIYRLSAKDAIRPK
jgi:hypothetical protein